MYVDTFLFLYIHIRIPFNQATYIDKEVSLVLYMGVPTPWYYYYYYSSCYYYYYYYYYYYDDYYDYYD